MKRIGLISDTHAWLDQAIFDHFLDCDEIWHAGDFGSMEIINKLNEYKSFKGVWGNIDDTEIRSNSNEYLIFELENIRFLMIHIAGAAGKYNSATKKLIKENSPQVLICGHSHIAKVLPDNKHGLIYINPGASGNQGFHKIRTCMKMDIKKGAIENLNVIELGKRGQL